MIFFFCCVWNRGLLLADHPLLLLWPLKFSQPVESLARSCSADPNLSVCNNDSNSREWWSKGPKNRAEREISVLYNHSFLDVFDPMTSTRRWIVSVYGNAQKKVSAWSCSGHHENCLLRSTEASLTRTNSYPESYSSSSLSLQINSHQSSFFPLP